MKINNSFLLLFSILNFVSFLIGFYYLEEHGASLLDANDHTYPVINGLKKILLIILLIMESLERILIHYII